MKKYQLHKQRRRKYRKVMASLTGAALLSTAMFGTPSAKAAESVSTEKSDMLSEALQRSKEEIQGRLQDKIVEKTAESLEAIKNNPEIVQQAWQKSKEFLEAKVKESVQAKVDEKRTEWAQQIGDFLMPTKREAANRVLDVTATAYTSGYEDNGIWNDKTHIGTTVRPGIIAVDPKVIPLGSKVYIDFGDGEGMNVVAEDTGGAIKGNRIDIALADREQVKAFGIQNVKVHVLEEGKPV